MKGYGKEIRQEKQTQTNKPVELKQHLDQIIQTE